MPLWELLNLLLLLAGGSFQLSSDASSFSISSPPKNLLGVCFLRTGLTRAEVGALSAPPPGEKNANASLLLPNAKELELIELVVFDPFNVEVDDEGVEGRLEVREDESVAVVVVVVGISLFVV